MWRPLPGSQTLFITCPVYEALYEGTRGPGKTDALINDFAQHVGRGYGTFWRGILFRHTFKQLEEVRVKTRRWFNQMRPKPLWNGSDHKWTWPDGEELLLRYMDRPDDYWNYHGFELPWIGWDELTNWGSPSCYEDMQACSRSSSKDVPRKIRATANPYGAGHNWVKARFVDPAPWGVVITDGQGRQRVRIKGTIWENSILLDADPQYVRNLLAITDEYKRKAWLEGSWDIVAGGFFDDLWRPDRQVLPLIKPPDTWRFFRSFDWGSAKPSSLGFWAWVADNTMVMVGDQPRVFPRGSLIRLKEWYTVERDNRGMAVPNRGLRLTNKVLGQQIVFHSAGRKWQGCIADPSIFIGQGGKSIYQQMVEGAKEANGKLKFLGAKTDRKAGWQKMREMLEESGKDCPEGPGLWITEVCREWLRTVPVLQRDEKDPDDVDTDQEDHAGDETRYSCMASIGGATRLNVAHIA